jgi:integrase
MATIRGHLVRNTMEEILTEGIHSPVKSIASRRRATLRSTRDVSKPSVVPLSRVTVELLRRVRASQAAEKLAAGPAYCEQGFVFATELGTPVPPHAASDAFRTYARRAGISSTRLHAARHTAATIMLGNGSDVRTVAGILGHSAPSTILNVYGHLIAAHAATAIDALGDELERGRSRRRRVQEKG